MAITDQLQFDQKSQVEQVIPWILPTEQLYAVFDCKGAGTGFVAVTDKRLLFYDKAFMRKRKALTSIPFSKVTAVSCIDEGGYLPRYKRTRSQGGLRGI